MPSNIRFLFDCCYRKKSLFTTFESSVQAGTDNDTNELLAYLTLLKGMLAFWKIQPCFPLFVLIKLSYLQLSPSPQTERWTILLPLTFPIWIHDSYILNLSNPVLITILIEQSLTVCSYPQIVLFSTVLLPSKAVRSGFIEELGYPHLVKTPVINYDQSDFNSVTLLIWLLIR